MANTWRLKRAGRNFKGLSPFGDEKTPSFVVSPEKQIWHDFSSGKGGNVFSFVMEMEGLDFKGALGTAGPQSRCRSGSILAGAAAATPSSKNGCMKLLELAAKFYQVQFSKNKTALDYVFKQRKFSKETALQFRLGYAPNNGTALIDFLKKQDFTEEEIKKAGLISQALQRAQAICFAAG